MLFRNVALIPLALVAAASAADTGPTKGLGPTSDHVSSLLSQRRLPKDDKEEKAQKDNKKKDNKKKNNKNNNAAGNTSSLQINNLEGLTVLGYGSITTLSGPVGDGTNTSGRPTGQTLIEPNREEEGQAGAGAGEASSEGPTADEAGADEAGADETGADDMGGDDGDDTPEDDQNSGTDPSDGSLTGCAGTVESLLAKGESVLNTSKRCKLDCDCADNCCVVGPYGSFCTPTSDDDETKSLYGGGFLYCTRAVRPSQ